MKPTNPLGLAQLKDFIPPKEITVHGTKWILRRDYRDPLTALPPPSGIKWDDMGSIAMPQHDGKVFWYCAYGTKMPSAGSQEYPVRVLYQWFHSVQIPLNPNFITEADWSKANIYVADYGAFAQDFFAAMFDVSAAVSAQAENKQEWPDIIDPEKIKKDSEAKK